MTPFFPAQFTAARTTPCVTRQSSEGVAISAHEGHLVISIVRADGSGMSVVLDDDAADNVAFHVAGAILAMTRREPPFLKLVQ